MVIQKIFASIYLLTCIFLSLLKFISRHISQNFKDNLSVIFTALSPLKFFVNHACRSLVVLVSHQVKLVKEFSYSM